MWERGQDNFLMLILMIIYDILTHYIGIEYVNVLSFCVYVLFLRSDF